MVTNENLQQALAILSEEDGRISENPPALVVVPPDDGGFILANRGGFIKLAIASLKAAQGKKQVFKKEPWFRIEDLDWGIDGLAFDESAHIYLPPSKTKWRGRLDALKGFGMLFAALACAFIGAITISSWIIGKLVH